jgi:NADPH-dependent 2,4-dienoyl-CoA reductase/sulfur reductase-like enzyme
LRTTGKTPTIDVGTVARIKAGEIAVRPAITSFDAQAVTFEDGRSDRFDQAILATGYRPQIERIAPAATPMLDNRGYPRAVWTEGPLSGLYLLGFNAYDSGGVLRRIRLDAARIADHIGNARSPEMP